MIIPLYKSKGEKTECSNYRGIGLSIAGKIYVGILRRDRKAIKGLIDDEQNGFRAGKEGVCRSDLHPKGNR